MVIALGRITAVQACRQISLLCDNIAQENYTTRHLSNCRFASMCMKRVTDGLLCKLHAKVVPAPISNLCLCWSWPTTTCTGGMSSYSILYLHWYRPVTALYYTILYIHEWISHSNYNLYILKSYIAPCTSTPLSLAIAVGKFPETFALDPWPSAPSPFLTASTSIV